MRDKPSVFVLIPAWNEEESLPLVLRDIPRDLVDRVIVCNNASSDRTVEVAQRAGAVVVTSRRRGYGEACLSGMRYILGLPASEQPDIAAFIDGDYSDYPEDLRSVVGRLIADDLDLVIGSRTIGPMQKGAMTPPQRLGNWLAPAMIKLLFGVQFSDLGPMRAVKWQSLLAMDMQDRTYGWTVEMQVKAAKMGMRSGEVAVRYRKRAAGASKVSGTIRGVVLAGWKIVTTILRLWIAR
ncbi:MAG: glycosyltransferase family 2 protein [Saprospiraceae bacterium]